MHSLVYEWQDEFGDFSIEDLIYEGRQARVLFSGPLHAAQSGIPLDDGEKMLFDYNHCFYGMVEELNPSNLLILGGGAMTLAGYINEHFPLLKLDVVEQNPKLLAAAQKYFGYKNSPRTKIHIVDAMDYLRSTNKTYDLIIVDLYNDFTVPQAFRKPNFASKLRSSLTTNGVVAANCISGMGIDASLPLVQLSNALKKKIGPVKIVQANSSYSQWISQNYIIISSVKLKLDSLLGDYNELKLPTLIKGD